MKEFYKRHKKKIIAGISFLFLFLGGYWSVRYQLPKTVEVIVQMITGAKISSDSIEFTKFGKIDIKNLKLSSKGELIIEAPKVEILYSEESLKNFRIEEIILYDGVANITREKNGDINIVAAFTGGTEEEPEKKEAKPKTVEVYKPGIGVPIDRITAVNATTNFTDLSYRKPIKETAYNTNGYLTFSQETGIDMIFKGTNGEQVYTYSLNTSEQPYDMNIKLENIAVRDDLLQYAYDGEEIDFNGGVLELDLSISPKGMFGGAEFKGVTVRYKELDSDVKVLDGTVDFQGKTITVKADYEIFDTKDKFLLVYGDNELNIDFVGRDINYEQLKKYKLIGGLNLPLKDVFIDEVKFNLNLNKNMEFSVNIDFFSKKSLVENLQVEKLKGRFIYDKEGLHIKDLNSSLALLNKKKEPLLKKNLAGTFDYIGTEGSFNFNLAGEDSINNYIPDINGVFNFDTGAENFKFNFLSNIIKVRGEYFSKNQKLLLYRVGKYSIEYDLRNKKLEKGSGVLDFNLYNLKFALDFQGKDNKILIEKLTAHNNKAKEEMLFLTGDIDLEDLSYNLAFNLDNFQIERKIKDEDISLSGTLLGTAKGGKEGVEVELDIKDISFKYLGEINNLQGKLSLKKSEKLTLDFFGQLGQIKYGAYDLNGIIFTTRIKDDKFFLKDFRNGIVSAEGYIDLKNLQSKMNFSVKNLNYEKFDIEFPKFYIKDVVGTLRGKIDNPNINLKVNDVQVELVENRKNLKISGDINYSDFKVYLNKIYLNTNLLNGSYSIKDKKYLAKLNIIEEDPSQYYSDTNLKYRVIGTLNLQGEGKRLKASLNSTVDKVYMRGTKLPNIYIEGIYDTEDISTGEIELKKIVLSNSEFKDILTLSAGYDIESRNIRGEIKNQKVNIENLKEYTKNEELKGFLHFDGNLQGAVDDLVYNLQVDSNQLSIKDISFRNFLIRLNGNLKELLLEEFSFKYLDNSFISKGRMGIEDKKYNFLVNSSKINLDFLNIFLEKYGITNIEGSATFNLTLKDDGNSGYFTLNNFGMEYKDLYIDLSNFNSQIKLDKTFLYLERFKGKLNGGDITMKGYLELPTLNDILENPYFIEELKYDVSLDTKGIDYNYKNYFELLFDTEFNIKNSKILGSIDINRGKVVDIPNNSKSIFKIIKDFLFKSSSSVVNSSEELGKDFEIKTIFEKSLELDVTMKINKAIELGIQDLNAFVEDVRGYVVGGGRLSGKNGKFNFIGDIEVKNGSLAVNGNTFELDKALVVFNDREDYFPNINPTLMIDSRVKVDSDEIGMSINGELDELRFSINSKNGSSSGNLSSLLVGEGEEEFADGASATLFKTVVGSQLSQTFFKPISKLVRNTLNISKFRIKSNILTEESQNPNEESSRLRLGAVIEAEDNIYKDKLYWVARGTLLGDDSTENNKEQDNGAFDEYDFSVEYRFRPGKSIGIGAGKLSRKTKNSSEEDSKDAINYHIDFKFEKKYDNLIDIFRKH